MPNNTTERDQGFAWVILLMSYLHNVISASVFRSAAIYMVDWIEEFDASKTEVALAGSIYGGVASFAGIFAGPLVNRFGCRIVSIAGTTISVVGFLSSTLASSIWWLYISYGILIGLGHALHFICPVIIVQYYFDKKRPLATGLSLIGHSSGNFIMLPILNKLVETFGWRSAMVIHAGLVMQLYIFSLFYRHPENKQENRAENQISHTEGREKNCFQKTLSFLQKTWNCNLLRNPALLQLLVSESFAQIAIDVMYRFSSIKAVAAGIDRSRASFLPSVIGLSSSCTRIVISFIANIKCVNRTLLCGASVLGQGCFVIASCFAWNFGSLIISMVLFGVCLGTHMTLITTVTVDLLGIENLANAHSFMSGAVSVSMLSGLTLTGLMVDKTGNYDLPNYIYGCMEMFAGLLLLCIPVTQRYHMRNEEHKVNEELNSMCDKEKAEMSRDDLYMSLQSLASFQAA